MGIICNKWPLDGTQKPFHGNVAGVPGQLKACLAYTGRAYEKSTANLSKLQNLVSIQTPLIKEVIRRGKNK